MEHFFKKQYRSISCLNYVNNKMYGFQKEERETDREGAGWEQRANSAGVSSFFLFWLDKVG